MIERDLTPRGPLPRFHSYLGPALAAVDARYRRDVETLERLVAESFFHRIAPTDEVR